LSFSDKNIHGHVVFGEVSFRQKPQFEGVAQDFIDAVSSDAKQPIFDFAQSAYFVKLGLVVMVNQVAASEIESIKSIVVGGHED